MRHDIHISGYGFRLRPIKEQDADFVIKLRTDSELGKYLHSTSASLDNQLAWLDRYFDREHDYYFVVESIKQNAPEGVISIYDIDPHRKEGEWGRWILRNGSLAAVESAWLIYRVAFDVLELEAVYCRTVAENLKVVSFHDSCGIKDRRLLSEHFELGGRRVDAIEHFISRGTWNNISGRLAKLSQATARRLLRG